MYICKKPLFSPGANSEGIVTTKCFKFASETDLLRVVQGQELNAVLLKLLDYLGHTNPIVSGVAFNEVRISTLFE